MADQSATPLIPEQRREQIVRHLRREQVLSYRQLTALLGVSHMTIRRDIAALEGEGRVLATPGGAKIASRLVVEPSRDEKSTADVAQKTAIAAHAASMISESMTVYLDAGTTLQAMRPYLEDFTDLTIVTNDLATASSYLDHPSIEIITVGGRVEKRNQSTVGRLAALTLGELSIDIAFLSTSSWDLRRGVTMADEPKVEPKKAAVRAASESVLVAASSKYGSFGRYKVLGLDELDVIVTDDALRPATASAIAELGVKVERVAPLAGSGSSEVDGVASA